MGCNGWHAHVEMTFLPIPHPESKQHSLSWAFFRCESSCSQLETCPAPPVVCAAASIWKQLLPRHTLSSANSHQTATVVGQGTEHNSLVILRRRTANRLNHVDWWRQTKPCIYFYETPWPVENTYQTAQSFCNLSPWSPIHQLLLHVESRETIPHTSNRRHSCHVCETEEAQLLKRMKIRFLTITCNCLQPTGLQSRHSYGMEKTLARPPHTAALATRLLETITWVVQVPLLGPRKRIVKVSQQQTPPRTFSLLQQEDAIWVPSSHWCLEGGFVGNPVSMGFTSNVLTPLLTGNLEGKQLS